MSLRRGKLPLILTLALLTPALIYGGLKGFMYYKAKQTVDEVVMAAADQADVRYADISTDLRGVVTVSGIEVQPLGYDDVLSIESVRIASDDPMFFMRSPDWESGEQQAPPSSLSFGISGVGLSLSSDFMRAAAEMVAKVADEGPLCSNGLQIEPALLSAMGISEINAEMDAHYDLDEAARTLDIGMNMEVRDIESLHLEATLSDVDLEAMASGAMPQISLGGFSVAMRISPEFGRRALEACAAGTQPGATDWSAVLADQAIQDLKTQGIVLGSGLSAAVRSFYREWGEARLVSTPQQPVGLLSMMFLPPEQLADTLNLRFSVNDQAVSDTRFTWQGPAAQELSALFGGEQSGSVDQAQAKPQRVVVRREYEPVAVRDIARYVDHQVHIKPHGQPLREGLLKRIRDGEAEVEQSLHGGKFTVYVPLKDIESMQALVQREISDLQ